jgi:hypothetical protein
MPVVKSYRHGLTGGVPPKMNNHQRAKRGEVEGWSEGATRRNTAFLRSIREDRLTGAGIAFTLTLRDCPPTAKEWHRLRKAWEMRMVRAGMIRLHWVTEWQRRGVPHLHGAIWWPDAYHMARIVDAWCDVASAYGAGPRGQHVRAIDGPVGWFQYLSKHASRGVKHYQRSAENLPEGWQKRTGRVWGKSGDWPISGVVEYRLDNPGWFAFRRLVRAWRKADARESGNAYRIRTARGMLTCHDRPLSEVRGVSEWLPAGLQDLLVMNVASRGFDVRC